MHIQSKLHHPLTSPLQPPLQTRQTPPRHLHVRPQSIGLKTLPQTPRQQRHHLPQRRQPPLPHRHRSAALPARNTFPPTHSQQSPFRIPLRFDTTRYTDPPVHRLPRLVIGELVDVFDVAAFGAYTAFQRSPSGKGTLDAGVASDCSLLGDWGCEIGGCGEGVEGFGGHFCGEVGVGWDVGEDVEEELCW